MADERIDIEINDKIADSIPKKLRDIGTNADKSQASVLRLKAALAEINNTPTARLKDATDSVSNSLNRELDAQKSATTGRAATVTAIDKEIAARARLSAMVDKSIAQQVAEGAATKARMAAGGSLTPGAFNAAEAGLGAGAGIASEAAALGGAGKAVEASLAETEAVAVSRFGRIKAAGLTAYDAIRDAGYTMAGNFKGFFGSSGAATIEKEGEAVAKLGAHAKGNSTAIRELLVLGREASNGNWTRFAGSLSILGGALGLLNVVLPVAVAGIVAFGAAKFALNTEAEKTSLRDYADTLGLTEKEMKKLSNTTVDASGKLHEHNVLQITWGDVFHGVATTIEQGASKIAKAWGLTTESARSSTSSVLKFMGDFFATLVGGVYAFAKFLYTEVANLFIGAQNLGTMVANVVYMTFAGVANGIIALFNGVVSVINFASNAVGKGDIVKQMDYLDMSAGRLTQGLKSFKGEDFFGDIRKGANATNKEFGTLRENIQGAARDRIKGLADAMKANRTVPKAKKESDADPKTKADYLYEENNKLDQEISRMHMLKDAREEQQKLDAIEEQFIKNRFPLTDKEIQGFRDKIHAIAEYKFVQAELDRIYEEAIKPQRDYNATLQAAKELLDKGAISVTRYSQEVNKAGRAFKEAADPLFKFREAMDQSELAVTKYGRAVQEATYYETLRQALLNKGTILSQDYVKGINAEVDALMARNRALQQAEFVKSTVSAIVDPMKQDQVFLASKGQFYAEIDRLRKNDVLNEEQAARAKQAILAKYDELRLQGASSVFGKLAGLAGSSNKKIAAIGKAAAVAQATIDGFLAVQKALASAPPPFNIALAAVTAAMTGAQVAGILSTNVGSFDKGTQFMVDGKAGVDRNNINMNVSRGERVTVETPAQQRANNRGQGTNVNVPVKIVNVTDPSQILEHLSGDEGERIIFNHLRNNPNQLKSIVQASS